MLTAVLMQARIKAAQLASTASAENPLPSPPSKSACITHCAVPALTPRTGKLTPLDSSAGKAGPGVEDVLNAIIPPREYSEAGQLWVQQVSSTPATRLDVIALQARRVVAHACIYSRG